MMHLRIHLDRLKPEAFFFLAVRNQLVSLWPEEGVTATNCLHTADQQVKIKEKAVAVDPEGILGNISMALLFEFSGLFSHQTFPNLFNWLFPKA